MSPDKLTLETIIIGSCDQLVVSAFEHVAIAEVPYPCTLWLVVLELTLEICAVGI